MNLETMPLLESLVPECKQYNEIIVLHINHCMDNSFYFTEQLRRVFGDVVFIAVPYNDRKVPENLPYTSYHGAQDGDGYQLQRNNKDAGRVQGDFVEAVRGLVRLALDGEIKEKLEQGWQCVIIEDGGYHYPVVEQWWEQYPQWRSAILGCVEQTTAGTRSSLQHEKLAYPVISVARSSYKIRIEAHFVANRVVDELRRMLRYNNAFIDFHHVLLVGYGIIGRSMAFSMQPHHAHIVAYDTDPAIAQVAVQDGFALWDGKFSDEMLILGNVGKASFTHEMMEQFLQGSAKRIYLASSSSKQVEFQAIFPLLATAERIPMRQADCYRFADGKELVLIAQGFPLNFYDKWEDSLTYGMIDPVFAEMLMSAQMLCEKHNKLLPSTYLFGVDAEAGGYEVERRLLRTWSTLNHLQFNFDTFNLHPQEGILREKALGRKQL